MRAVKMPSSQLEHGLQALHRQVDIYCVIHRLEVRHGAVEELRHDALGQPVNHIPLAHAQPRELLLRLAQLVLADPLRPHLQLVDHRHRRERVLPVRKRRHLILQQVLRLQHQAAPPRLIRRHHRLEIVHVVRMHARHEIRTHVIDVPRNGNVNQDCVLRNHGLQIRLEEDRLHGAGACKRYMVLGDLRQHFFHGAEVNLEIRERIRKLLAAFRRTIQNGDAFHVPWDQVLHQEPCHFSSSKDANIELRHIETKIGDAPLLDELHGCRGDAHPPSRDPRLRSNPLSSRNRRIQHAPQNLSRGAFLLRRKLIASLDLRQDLSLSNDQRIQA
mmetsp:Transcript_43568/g.91235  ORF Transcript_43568/g.91235 Transcript_43568/m.91235 type:complete len:330 (+) Transcript_43568:183-1172(+)